MSVERVPRIRTFLGARIEFNGGMSTLDCSVRDLSETGARLELADSVAMPGKFRLYIPKSQRWYEAETRWHRGNSVGIQFVGRVAPPAAAPQATDDARLARLEAEVVRLRGLLEQIRTDPTKALLVLETLD